MGSIGSITSTVQAAYTGSAIRKVAPLSNTAPTRDTDGDSDHSPPGGDIWSPGKGNVVDVYA